MTDVGTNRLAPDEVRSLSRRILAMRVSLGVSLVVALVSLFTLGHLGEFVWLAPVVPVCILSTTLYVRATRCPRCRRSVWSDPPPGEDGNPGFALFGQFHPDNCRACGIRLT